MTEITCKLLVIGAGPGGYVCAIRAGQLGIDTVIVNGAITWQQGVHSGARNGQVITRGLKAAA